MTAEVVGVEKRQVAPLGTIMGVSLEHYHWAKEKVATNKTLGPRVGPLIESAEDTAKLVLKKSPIQIEDVVAAIDTRVDRAVNYGSETVTAVAEAPGKLKNKTLSTVHDNLNKLKIELPAEESSKEEAALRTIAEDAKVITSERMSQLLDASEGYMAQYLPISEEDKAELAVATPRGELKPVFVRAGKQGQVAARRLQQKAFEKLSNLKQRTGEVVHVDLVKYSEFLDKQKEGVKNTIYITMDKIDAKVVQPTKEVANKGRSAVSRRVITPAKDRFHAITLPIQDRVITIWTAIGDAYEEKVVMPRDNMVNMFREELENQKNIAKIENGDKELTITAGMKAVITAARKRFGSEWELRISPRLARFLGRETPADEADEAEADEAEVEGEVEGMLEEKSVDDADDADEEEDSE